MRNYFIFIGLLAVLVTGLVVVSFSVMGNPFDQKLRAKDEAIISDFNNITSSVVNFYQLNHQLPESLSELQATYGVTDLTSYQYEIVSATSYNLCSTFSTDTKTRPSPDTSYYPVYDSDYSHPKGPACILFKVPTYLIPTPTLFPTPTFSPTLYTPTPIY